MKVYIGKYEGKKLIGQQVVEAEIVKRIGKNYHVRLPDGNVIKRKEQHLVKDDESKG